MPKRHPTVPSRLMIHPVFEPSRLARKYLDEAYAYLVHKHHAAISESTPAKPTVSPPESQGGTAT